MPQKPPEHYGREAYQLLDAMREAVDENDEYPDSLVADVEETMQSLKAEYTAVKQIREGEVDA